MPPTPPPLPPHTEQIIKLFLLQGYFTPHPRFVKLPGSDIPDIPVPPEYMPPWHTWPRHEAFARAYRRELSLIILGEDKIFANTAATATGHIINPPPSTKVYNDLQKVLGKQRRIDCIQRDGNCLFRAMSKELLGHEKFHYLIRLLL